MMTTQQVKTASTCPPPETAQGTHVFDILGYSKHRGMGADYFIRSGVELCSRTGPSRPGGPTPFMYVVHCHELTPLRTGLDWGLRCCSAPVIIYSSEGCGRQAQHARAGPDLRLLSMSDKVRASCDLRLVNPATGVATSVHPTLIIDSS
ncbi:unnamed protein product [Miscanthus lutarioriparius]|uniref:Uncharacterized protein n=1 Tax=Miscanthus lutarioriparius TaxID=422564 RepID=A0A811R715_9POAL|nr:unnamed protein product [Miscanthus lutarioriparius]